jgi:diacylglycerol O-acyltransferase / wax synthase
MSATWRASWPMSPEDAIFHTVGKEAVSQTISMVVILDRVPDRESLRRSLARIVPLFPKFHWRVAPGLRIEWQEDVDFDVNRHLEWNLAPPISTVQELLAAASQHICRPLPPDRPLWRFTILADQAESHVCLVATANHSITDAVGAFAFWNALCSENSDHTIRGAPELAFAKPRGGPRLLAATLRQFLTDCSVRCQPSPLTGKKSTDRILLIADFSRAAVRAAMRKRNCSMQELMLAIVAGTAHRYHAIKQCVGTRELQVLIPFDTRRSRTAMGLANQFVTVRVPLNIGQNSPDERVAAIRSMMQRYRSEPAFRSAQWASALTLRSPAWMQRRILEQVARQSHFFCTVVPGPAHRQTLAGAAVQANYLTAAHLNFHGASFSFLTYAGKVHAAILIDPAVIGEPRELESHFHESASELLELEPHWCAAP